MNGQRNGAFRRKFSQNALFTAHLQLAYPFPKRSPLDEVHDCSSVHETHWESFFPHPQQVLVPLAEQASSGAVHEQLAHVYAPKAMNAAKSTTKIKFFFNI